MDKIRNLFGRGTPQSAATDNRNSMATADQRRESRAIQISSLQDQVSHLQQEIATLSHEANDGVGPKMTALEGELTKVQQELGQIKGRI